MHQSGTPGYFYASERPDSQGRITIPKPVRRTLNLIPGESVDLYIDPKTKAVTIVKTGTETKCPECGQILY